MTPRKPRFITTFALFFGCSLLLGGTASGAERQTFIRDTEIENTIREYAVPLLNAAGLDKDAFHVHIIKSTVLNAFVAHGQRLFVTTGLLRRTENAGQLLGVMAHEIGHIEGGHLARMPGELENASAVTIASQILGIALGVLAGEPGAAVAIGSGGQQIAQRSVLAFSRSVEQSADRAGVTILDRAGFSSRGMLQFLEILQGQEALQTDLQDAYVQTHPLTRDRIAFVRHHVETSPLSNRPVPARFERLHARMVAKLNGFLDPPSVTLRRYPATDKSVPARYARSVALFELADIKRGLPLINGLIADHPKDPYFQELKGQMLFENGRLPSALKAYREAVRLLPNAPLLQTSLAHVEIETGREDLLDDALKHLKAALRTDQFIPLGWHLAGTAYGRKGDMGHASWALAEYNLLIGRKRDAAAMADRALRLLKRGEPAWIRAQDIKEQTSQKG